MKRHQRSLLAASSLLITVLVGAPAEAQNQVPPATAPNLAVTPAGSNAKDSKGKADLEVTTTSYEAVHPARVSSVMALAGELRAACGDKTAYQRVDDDAVRGDAARSLVSDASALGKADAARKKALDTAASKLAAQKKLSADEAKKILPADLGDKLARLEVPAATPALTIDALCTELCTIEDSKASIVDFCALDQPVAANAAVAADWPTVRALAGRIEAAAQTNWDAATPDVAAKQSPRLRLRSSAAAITAKRGLEAGAEGLLAAFSSQLLPIAFQGLARLIDDRMKQEAVGWALDRIGDDICGKAEDKPELARARAYAEVKGYWFPSLCRLATQKRLHDYGAGASMLKALRASLVEDFKAWPGAGGGLALGAAFWEEARAARNLSGSVFACGDVDADATVLAARAAAVAHEAAKVAQEAAEKAAKEDPKSAAKGEELKKQTALTQAAQVASEKAKAQAAPLLHACAAVGKVRIAAGQQITGLLDGRHAALVLERLSGEIDAGNRFDEAGTTKLYSPTMQVAACVSALPRVFSDLQAAIRKSSLDDAQAARATAIAAFVTVPACWTIVGKGIPTAACEAVGGSKGGKSCSPTTALKQPVGLERISTVVALEKHLGAKVQALATQWNVVRGAAAEYQEASAASTKALAGLEKIQPPSLQGAKLDQAAALGEAVEAYVAGVVKSFGATAQARHLNAALALGEASVGLARAGIAVLLTATCADHYPGLVEGSRWATSAAAAAGCTKTFAIDFDTRIRDVDDTLATFAAMLGGARAIAAQDWAAASTRVTEGLRHALVKIDGAGDALDAVGKHGGLVIAILSARDGDQMAQALNAVVAPPGGWRAKGQAGTFTFSLVAHPGLFAAGEARWGPYGARYERGKPLYGQAPTLAMPVGLEFAFGNGSGVSPVALFFPIIDPAAFLEYDVSKGRLPGPSVKTVLSPGVGLRLGIKNTPFSFMPVLVYRPGLRLWKPEAGGNGADALQLGLLLSVDVSLFAFINHETR